LKNYARTSDAIALALRLAHLYLPIKNILDKAGILPKQQSG
jgi:hypothetical protein